MSVLLQLEVAPGGTGTRSAAPISGLCTDVSRGGLAAWVGDEIPASSDCLVHFFNSRGRIRPEVAWGAIRRSDRRRDGYVIGVQFNTPLEFLRLAEPDRPVPAEENPRAMVVDDDEETRNFLRHFLRRRGFDVQTASDGEAALELITEDPPDLLVMDLFMPKINGHEVLKHIQENEIPIGVICTISGHASDDDARECLRLGAADHLSKPVSLKQLDWSIRLRLDAGR